MRDNLLQDLIASSGKLHSAPHGLTSNKVLMDTSLGAVKIRAYSNIEHAQNIETILLKIAEKIEYPELFGCWEQFLIFKYLEVDPDDLKLREQETYFGIGKFLANLNTIEMPTTNLKDLDAEFIDWLHRFGTMRLLPQGIVKRIAQHYQNLRPENLIVRLDYWDAMPHNFGWVDDKLFLLDEKHLRPSFSGVGLIKLLFLSNKNQWNQIRAGYQSVAPLKLFDQQRNFLSFYYLTAALYFYSLAAEAGRLIPVKNARFLHYRDEIIATVTNNNLTVRLLSELHMLASFPKFIPSIIIYRLQRMRKPNKKIL